jgi:carbon monoxide dehydrogenase subunit G
VQLENSFTVPVPIDDAWRVLLDIERIAPCMPGAALDTVDGDAFTGRVKVKLGPINLTYQGKAAFVEKDEASHRAVIDAKGKDQRGNGTAAAVVTATLAEEGTSTRVDVLTDLNITGRPAQFGRGVMTDVGNKLLGQFADRLAAQLGSAEDVPVDQAAAAEKQEPTAAGAAKKAAATATGAVEEVAASAEQVEGDGAAAQAVKKAGAASKKAAAAATESVSATEKVPAKKAAAKKAEPARQTAAKQAAPAKQTAPAKEAEPAKAAGKSAAPAAQDSAPAARDTAPSANGAPSAPPSGTTAPPTKPATGGPRRMQSAAEPEPIDLLEVAGGAAMTRLAVPAAGVVGLLLLIVLLVRRRRSRR